MATALRAVPRAQGQSWSSGWAGEQFWSAQTKALAAQGVTAGFASSVGGLEDLGAALDSARAGDDHDAPFPDAHPVDGKG